MRLRPSESIGCRFLLIALFAGLACKGSTGPAGDPGPAGDAGTVTVNGIECKSVFSLYKAEVTSKTLTQWAGICGVDSDTIKTIAQNLADQVSPGTYGRKTAIWDYRGTVQHTNGTMASFAVQGVVNLIGNIDYRGGMTVGPPGVDAVKTGSDSTTDVKSLPSGSVAPSGPRLDRVGGDANYRTYDYYTNLVARDGYPAKRAWFPFAQLGNFQEVVPSIADQYPYPTKVLITYWNAFPYSVPALRRVFEETVSDLSKLPLFVAIDPIIGENSAWADYILPDTTYLEKWAFPGSGNASGLVHCAPFQQPVVGTLDGNTIGGTTPFDPTATNAYVSFLGSAGPKMAVDIVRDLAAQVGLTSAVGTNVFQSGISGNFDRAWDLWKRMLNNFAANGTTAEGSTVTAAMVAARGGYFKAQQGGMYTQYDGTVNGTDSLNLYLKNRYGKGTAADPGSRYFYCEPLVTTKTWSASTTYYAIPASGVYPVPRWEGITNLDGSGVIDAAYPFQMITYKRVYHGQARTHVNPWLMLFEPENYVLMAAADGRALGVETGDSVRVISASNPTGIVGKAKLTEGLRPGVIAISHHYGHWEGGARPQVVTGSSQFTSTKSEGWRGGGITANGVMRLDGFFPNVSLQDRLGGSVAFNDTRVAVEKVNL